MFVDKLDDEVTPKQITTEYQEAIDIFPALHKYQADHSEVNLQKLCVEIKEFIDSVYASTRTENERKIINTIIYK